MVKILTHATCVEDLKSLIRFSKSSSALLRISDVGSPSFRAFRRCSLIRMSNFVKTTIMGICTLYSISYHVMKQRSSRLLHSRARTRSLSSAVCSNLVPVRGVTMHNLFSKKKGFTLYQVSRSCGTHYQIAWTRSLSSAVALLSRRNLSTISQLPVEPGSKP